MKKKKKAEREAAGVGGFYAKKFLGMGGAGWLGWGARHPGAVSSRTVAPAAWWGQQLRVWWRVIGADWAVQRFHDSIIKSLAGSVIRDCVMNLPGNFIS